MPVRAERLGMVREGGRQELFAKVWFDVVSIYRLAASKFRERDYCYFGLARLRWPVFYLP